MPAFRSAKSRSCTTAEPISRSRTPIAKGPERRPGRHRQGPSSSGETFRAGEIVKQSGIYEAIHEGAHRNPHDVVMIASDLFPKCDTCTNQVRFRLLRTAPYIFTDEDFEKPK
jgi:hypothetical protein